MTAVFKRLLLATEHSEFDTGVEALALTLARRCGLPLAGVLPIVSNPEYETLAPQLAAKAEAQAGEQIRELQAQAAAAGVAFDLRARRGEEPYLEIVDEALDRASDLLLIRRRGKRSFLAQLMMGEMVSKVVAHSPCSVLIAPRAARLWSRRVLVAVDPKAVDLRIVRLGAALAAECGVPVSLVAVADNAAAEAQRLAQDALHAAAAAAAEVTGQAPDRLLRSGRPHQQIVAAAAEQQADLIVIGRHGEGRLARVWLGGVTQRVVGLAEQPVLVAIFPLPKEPTPP